MSSFSLALVTSLAFATYAESATAQSAVAALPGNGGARPMLTLQMPPIPDPVPVTLKPASTAVLVFDIVDRPARPSPNASKPWSRQSVRFWHGREKPVSLWDTGRERQRF